MHEILLLVNIKVSPPFFTPLLQVRPIMPCLWRLMPQFATDTKVRLWGTHFFRKRMISIFQSNNFIGGTTEIWTCLNWWCARATVLKLLHSWTYRMLSPPTSTLKGILARYWCSCHLLIPTLRWPGMMPTPKCEHLSALASPHQLLRLQQHDVTCGSNHSGRSYGICDIYSLPFSTTKAAANCLQIRKRIPTCILLCSLASL